MEEGGEVVGAAALEGGAEGKVFEGFVGAGYGVEVRLLGLEGHCGAPC